MYGIFGDTTDYHPHHSTAHYRRMNPFLKMLVRFALRRLVYYFALWWRSMARIKCLPSQFKCALRTKIKFSNLELSHTRNDISRARILLSIWPTLKIEFWNLTIEEAKSHCILRSFENENRVVQTSGQENEMKIWILIIISFHSNDISENWVM